MVGPELQSWLRKLRLNPDVLAPALHALGVEEPGDLAYLDEEDIDDIVKEAGLKKVQAKKFAKAVGKLEEK